MAPWLGVVFDNYLTLEVGLRSFNNIAIFHINNTNTSSDVKVAGVDSFLGFLLPIKNGFYLKTISGVVFLRAQPGHEVRIFSSNDYKQEKVEHFRPILGIGWGLEHNFAQHSQIIIETDYTRVLTHRVLPPIDYLVMRIGFIIR